LDVIYTRPTVGEEMKRPEGLVNGVFPARLSLAYHAGVSYLMLRRYHDAYKLQVQQFMGEMATHVTLRKMRSYMSLYTSIEVEKLASFNDKKVQEFGPWLTCSNAESALPRRASSEGGWALTWTGLALDIHYHVSGNVVHVDEAEKTRRFETFFMKQIENNDDILRQLGNIKIEM
jgi:translation initiation factor 3 subunit L